MQSGKNDRLEKPPEQRKKVHTTKTNLEGPSNVSLGKDFVRWDVPRKSLEKKKVPSAGQKTISDYHRNRKGDRSKKKKNEKREMCPQDEKPNALRTV